MIKRVIVLGVWALSCLMGLATAPATTVAPVSPVSAVTLPHPIHVSLVQLAYNLETGTFQAAIKLFTDDLIAAIKATTERVVDFPADGQSLERQQLLMDFCTSNFKLRTQKGPIEPWTYIGYEPSGDGSTWVYLESQPTERPTKVRVSLKFFLDMYIDQRNLITFTLGEKELYGRLEAGETTLSWNLDE